MKNTVRRIFIIAFFLFVLCLLPLSANQYVRVMVTNGEDYTVTSPNPIMVPMGGQVSFTVDTPDGYDMVQLDTDIEATFDKTTKTLTLYNIRYPVTCSMRMADNPQSFRFFLENEGGGGYVGADIKQGTVREGTVAHIFVNVKEGYQFDGWSLEKSIAKGGKVISKDENYTYTVKQESFLYANFSKKPQTAATNTDLANAPKQSFTYYLNGGTYQGKQIEMVNIEVPAVHTYQNSLADKDYFTREGYQLIEYNTKADGTGDGYSLGSKILVTKEKPVKLYCIWAKESDSANFRTATVKLGLAITEYTADEETVVIPAKINGKDVVQINKGAFRNKNFTTVVIPKSVTKVESNAFIGTAKFETLYMFDTMLSIPNDAFADVSNFQHFCLNAVLDPRNTYNTSGNFVLRFERLAYVKQINTKPAMIFVAGSSAWYGIDSKQMDGYTGGKYNTVNYGTNAGTCILFYMEIISRFVTEGDVVIHSPEYTEMTHGSGRIVATQFTHTEYNWNMWRYVDMRNYNNYFASFSEWNNNRIRSAGRDYYGVMMKEVDEIGDHASLPTTLQKENYHNGSTFYFVDYTATNGNRERLNKIYQQMLDRGAKCFYSVAPCNAIAIAPLYRSREMQDEYMRLMKEAVIVPVISHVADYIFEPKYMYNSDYHLGAVGREMRTKQLWEDLKEWLD